MTPATSTIVATNGVEADAGSNPTLLKIKGSIDPMTVPQITTPTKLMATTNPIDSNP